MKGILINQRGLCIEICSIVEDELYQSIDGVIKNFNTKLEENQK